MKKLLLLLFLLPAFAFAQRLSPQAEISVMTLGPWQGELYSAFGHSAFRVNDPVNRIDFAYNYGVFDFDQPNFYLNFARGYLYYKLGVYPYRNFERSYIYYNRYVHEQVLNLTTDQKQRLFEYLQWNAKPENQFYRYDYFYNNCATKMPGVIKTVFKDSVIFDGSYIQTDYTIRELTDLYLEYQPWGDLGIDIGLGMPIDKVANPYEYMFLPDYVESGFAHATILHGNQRVPLVAETNRIYESTPEAFSRGIFQPLYVFSFFFLVIASISYRDLKSKKLTGMLDVGLFGVLGILGLLLLLLWVATDHHASAKNLNLLWALPLHLVAVMAFIRQPKWLENYFFGVMILMTALVVFWAFLPQQLHYALIPVVMAAGLRAYVQYKVRSERRRM